MKDELLVKARKALDELWNNVPVHGRTWGLKKNSMGMRGSHITLMTVYQCVTIWEREDRLRIRIYGKGDLSNKVIKYLKDAGLGLLINIE